MSRRYKINRRRRRAPVLIPLLVLLAVAALVSLGIAAVWQTLSGDDEKLAASSAAQKQASSTAQTVPSAPSALPASSAVPEPASSAPEPPLAPVAGALPESERVKSDYFDDAVFVGDSLTTGIELYQMMSNTTVLAGKGLNLRTIYTQPVIKQEDGSRITVMEALGQAQYGKVYVMMGGNEVREEDKQVFIQHYGGLIDDIQKLQPDALIYVQSMLPVTENNNYHMDNGRIDEFNEALSELCAEKGVYYVYVAECMKDERGMLPTEASPADGMHIGPDYYNKWFEYLKTHTAA